MKKALFILLYTIISSGTGAQNIFDLQYNIAPDFIYCTQIRSDPSGGYFVSGEADDFSTQNSLIVRLNDNGLPLWAQKMSIDIASNISFQSSAGYSGGLQLFVGYSIGMNQYLLVCTDANGNIQWHKVFNSAYYISAFQAIVDTTADGGFVVCGDVNEQLTNDKWTHLFKVDASGNVVWSRLYNHYVSAKSTTFDMHQCPDNGFIISGYEVDSTINIFLTRTDSTGNLLWTKYYHATTFTQGSSMCLTADHGYAVCALESFQYTPALLKTDSMGNVVWYRKYPGMSAITDGNSVIQRSDLGYMMAVNSSSTANYQSELLGIDPTGNIQWARVIENELLQDIDHSNTQSAITVGYEATNFAYMAVRNTDPYGHSGCDTTDDLTSISLPLIVVSDLQQSNLTLVPITHNLTITPVSITSVSCGGIESVNETGSLPGISIFPNPASSEISISGLSGPATLRLYDPLGNLIYENKTANDHLTLNLDEFAEGIYLLICENEERIVSRKLVITNKR